MAMYIGVTISSLYTVHCTVYTVHVGNCICAFSIAKNQFENAHVFSLVPIKVVYILDASENL